MDHLLNAFYFLKVFGVLEFLSEWVVGLRVYFGQLFDCKDTIDIAV